QAFAGLDHTTANQGMRIGQRGQRGGLVQAAQNHQRPDGLDPRLGPLRGSDEFAQGLDGRAVVPVLEQSLGSVALPAAWGVEGRDQTGRFEPIQPGDRPRAAISGINPINTPLLATGAEINSPLYVRGDPLGVLDDRTVHVGHPECSVGPGLHLRGPKPVVAGGQELAFGLIRSPNTTISCPVRLQNHPSTRLCTGSLTNRLVANSGPKRSSR